MLTARPRGTKDILPDDAVRWRHIEGVVHRIAGRFAFGEIRTPLFEHTELFHRGVGEDTDIVEKEMYTFPDRAGRSLTLRPEGTAPVVRAYLENRLDAEPQPVKLYYVASPMFRYDRPAAGRYRQFHQSGAEIFGSADPAADAEVVSLAWTIFVECGLKGLETRLNSIGCPVCRPAHRERLREYYRPHLGAVCPDCRQRFERNPLRLIDCKAETCRTLAAAAPPVTASLCGACREHFDAVQGYLRALGIPYTVDPGIVRGLDYYTRTVFEVTYPGTGAQSSLCGGGRYDGLVEALGGRPTPAVGFALGMERLLIAMEKEGVLPSGEDAPDVFVACAGPAGDAAVRHAAAALLQSLRAAGLRAEMELGGRGFKAQMKHAGRIGARYVAVIGEDEAARGVVGLRDMAAGVQVEMPHEAVAARLAAGLAEVPRGAQPGVSETVTKGESRA